MAVLALLAAQLIVATALPVNQAPPGVIAASNLRGSEAVPPAASAPAPATTAAPFVDERGERGHFYYSDACEDCFYKGAQCGCRPAVEYFACLTKHCHAANRSRFNEKCVDLGGKCSSELDIDCRGPDTVCEGKYSQLPSGGLGLTLDLEGMNDDAFCGPHGKCLGEIHMKVSVHRPLAQPTMAFATVGAPSAAPAAAPEVPQPTWLECGLPSVQKADFENQAHWTICRAEVVGDKAACDLPMFPTLAASQDKKAYCVLTEGTVGNPPKRLTAPAWHAIGNAHSAPSAGQPTKAGPAAGSSGLPWAK